ncbi:DNA double-strand break repair nuclease NurA [Halospeciosus flavus]|uniref:DNA double-strand break repair nuclease NurA n=1 Tax=Halospeciosus flavus TaxID=3032283 RepID=A0ABD5Z8F6_9EURY|nr:DNA double-strand break repair nuclease NurA [Halospeciosus flavus]
MTLDPVHFGGITDLVGRVSHGIDEEEHRDEALRAWETYFDPLFEDGNEILTPVGERRRYAAAIDEAGVQPDQFDTVHGLDSGTINPRAFKNGLVLDVAQAAMSVTPSDEDVHRSRTVVATVHASDETVQVPEDDTWQQKDEGFWWGKIFEAPRVDRDERAVVHALSLYLAESEHAKRLADGVDDLLVLDGPLYPKIITNWLDQSRPLSDLPLENDLVQKVVANYIGLVETFVERDVPLMGFVKNVQSRGLVRTLGRKGGPTPWNDDAAFFSQLLERRESGEEGYERRTDDLTYTNWFVSRLGYDREFSRLGDYLGVETSLDPEAYEVAFFVLYEPRSDVVYKVEMPAAFARDDAVRERVTRQVLRDVAEHAGPPPAVARADELAKIGHAEKAELIPALEEALDSEYDASYDDRRWGIE